MKSAWNLQENLRKKFSKGFPTRWKMTMTMFFRSYTILNPWYANNKYSTRNSTENTSISIQSIETFSIKDNQS